MINIPTAPYPTIPAISCPHVLGRWPVASSTRGIKLPFVFHSFGRSGEKSLMMLCIETMLRRVAKYWRKVSEYLPTRGATDMCDDS